MAATGTAGFPAGPPSARLDAGRRRLIQPGETARSRAEYRRSRHMTAAPQIARRGH